MVGQGQTLGKRFMGIKVVGKDGRHLSLPRSFLRYSIFAIPSFCWKGDFITLIGFAGFAFFGFLGVGLDAVICYLYIFNRQTRQSLHDLAVDSYVVDYFSTGRINLPKIWKGHRAASAILGLGVPTFMLLAALLIPSMPQARFMPWPGYEHQKAKLLCSDKYEHRD